MTTHDNRWLEAARRHFLEGGLDAISIEALARDLGLTKGSFYWHYKDRAALLDGLLGLWESETADLIREAGIAAEPLGRVLRFFELVARDRGRLPDTEFFAWARRDPAIAARAAGIENRRVSFIRDQLREAGLSLRDAERRAEAGYLATQGWIERAGRRRDSTTDFLRFTQYLFKWLFQGVRTAHQTGRAARRLAEAM